MSDDPVSLSSLREWVESLNDPTLAYAIQDCRMKLRGATQALQKAQQDVADQTQRLALYEREQEIRKIREAK